MEGLLWAGGRGGLGNLGSRAGEAGSLQLPQEQHSDHRCVCVCVCVCVCLCVRLCVLGARDTSKKPSVTGGPALPLGAQRMP